MLCPNCDFDNPVEMNFCGRCATPLKPRCAQCDFENPAGFLFCGRCAAPLTAEVQSQKSQVQGPRSKVRHLTFGQDLGERRQLTVMFCDLVGSTALSERLDPEELREVVRAYQYVSAEVIGHYDGYIAQYLGDGLLVYFGYPAAHEDDAKRAVHAGLEIVEAIQALPLYWARDLNPLSSLQEKLPHPLQVRVGIHTGLVVVGEVGAGEKRELLALGETPNIAARIQGLAEPDTVAISAVTHHLVQGFFTCQDLGSHILKGISAPTTVYHVVETSGVHSRFEVAVRIGLTPLVGRDEEMGLLLRRWEKVKAGEGQLVLLSGEAGIGKSRLVQELKERVTREGNTRIEFRCSPYYQNTAFYPVIDHLQRLLQFQSEDRPQEKLAKLERMLKRYSLPLQEATPLFAALLSLPHPEGYPAIHLTPQRQRQKTQEALGEWLLAEAKRKAVLAVWEDLQWADPSTLELHGVFMDRTATVPLLTVLTFRPEFTPPWGSRPHLTSLTLSRLERGQIETMVAGVAKDTSLPTEILRQVVDKTDGVPLFIEELTKMVVESVGTKDVSPLQLSIPSTLHDALMARLDRLSTAKDLAQLGATLGREFPYELLQAVSPLNASTLQQSLARLVEAEILYQRGAMPQARYFFKHALIQDAAYQSLLKSKRQQYHQQIVQVLEEQFAEVKETQPELLAHHYTGAGLSAQAIPYWQQAGQRAAQRSANLEAIGHFTKGLETLKTLPNTPERIQQELKLQIALGSSLLATRGYGSPAVGSTFDRARELCQQIGETPQLFPVLMGLRSFCTLQGEIQTARALGEQLLRLSQSVQDPALLVEAHWALVPPLYLLGEFTQAQAHWEQSLAFYSLPHHRTHGVLYGQDPAVGCLSVAAAVLWMLGYPDQALKKGYEAVTLAQELSHPLSLAFALIFVALTHLMRREAQPSQKQTEAAIALSRERELPFYLTVGTIWRGWALADQGQGEEGIAQIRQGLTGYSRIGAEGYRTGYLGLLAESYGKVGRVDEGLAVLAEALAVVEKIEEHFVEAYLYQLKGKLTLQKGARDWGLGTSSSSPQAPSLKSQVPQEVEREAEEYFIKAIEIARRQQAKSWELRATTSLAQLWRQQGKMTEARQMLAEIYNWFTEGFDTKDLQEAKALLEELSE